MKKLLSVFLSLVLALGVIVPAAFASNEQYPIVFVTGIGQTFSYYLEDNSEKTMYLNGEEHHFSTMANLFMLDTEIFSVIGDIFSDIGDGEATCDEVINALKQVKNNKILQNSFGTVEGAVNFVKVLEQLIFSLSTGLYSINYDDLCTLARGILHDNIIDENGKLPEYILPTSYECPVSEFDVAPDGTIAGSYGKGRFYRDIPCQDILAGIGEDKVFCYNYPAFGNLTTIAEGLDHLINDVILGEDGYFPDADKVVLIPMSMGAAMVSQYLYNCEQAGKDPHVARVVSIVGCWNGSDIMADLIERKYAENSAEQFYTRWPVITGDNTTGMILNNVWRLFRHDVLSKLVTNVLGAICDELVLKSPSMLALIPSDRYDAIRNTYLTRPGYEKVLAQLDTYHKVQTGLKDRMEKFNKDYGVEFYFLSGYGLNLGAGSETYASSGDNYSFFGFLYSANKVNSDEIIPIQSTAPGTTCVKVGEKFSDEYLANAEKNGTAKYIDTFSQSIDLSTSYYPDHTWTFYQQVHQLDDNNTALRLAFKIATGEINSVDDCKDTFPQFNDSRNMSDILGDVDWIEKNIINADNNPNADALKAEAQEYLDKADAIKESTINHRDDEEAFAKELSEFRDYASKVLKGETPEEPAEETVSGGEKFLTAFDSILYKLMGYYGLPDVLLSFAQLVVKAVRTVWNVIAAL